ncbi:MAG: SDR family NAD(P)-dependent oxidoreductase [Lachnospiraceae bacterium]|nr:SDR family NAD(P)-dependent oxidoreductase [Lachnospiraceae bacterium]
MKNVLITGYSRGLGYCIAKELSRQDVSLIGVSASLRDCEFDIDRYRVDFRKPDEVEEFAKRITQKYSHIDVLINNAGIYIDDPRITDFFIRNINYDIISDTVNVNYYAAYILIRHIIEKQIENGYGRIINISSGMGRLGEFDEYSYAYRLSKLMSNTLTISYSELLKKMDCDVSIMSVCPGWIRTDMGTPNAPDSPEKAAGYIANLYKGEKRDTNGYFFRNGDVLSWMKK